jgi:MFS family permease
MASSAPIPAAVSRRLPPRRRLPQLARTPAFWVAAGVMAVLFGGSAAVSPLYGVDQRAWHFSATSLTTVFAVYALALLAVLLVAGSVSDVVGRRPMMMAGLSAEVVAAALLVAAHGLPFLYAARLLQGVASGAAVGAVSATLIELGPSRRPTFAPAVNTATANASLAAGALGASALIQYGPDPTRLVFWLLLAASVAGLAFLVFAPEPVERRQLRPSHLRPRAGVPAPARGAFLIAVPALVAPWALGGFYFSLGPSLAGQLTRSPNLLWGGLVIFLLSATGGVAALVVRAAPPRRTVAVGAAVLAAGSLLTVAGIVGHSAAGLLAGTVVAGAGFGATFQSAFRMVVALGRPAERGALLATVYTVAYLSFSLPAVVAGIATTAAGLRETSIVYGGGVAAIALGAALVALLPDRRPTE